MTDIPFTYAEFEQGAPDWSIFEYGYFKDYPSVQWKQMNIQRLKSYSRHY